jgi:small GTP-binding protein
MTSAGGADDTTGLGRVAVLVGNPNVGKSVLFKNLTDRYVTVSNFPGTTVEIVQARASLDGHEVAVIDTPGINDLSQRSDEARVTRELLVEHEGTTIVQVADAKNLRRALLLTLQLADLKRPTVLVLNMADELEERGGQVDCARLSEILGVPVVMTVAPRNQGTQQLIEALAQARPPHGSWLAAEPVNEYAGNRARLGQVNDIMAETYSMSQPKSPSFKVRLGAAGSVLDRGLVRCRHHRGRVGGRSVQALGGAHCDPGGRCSPAFPARSRHRIDPAEGWPAANAGA